MSLVKIVLKANEKVFDLEFAYSQDKKLCASFPENLKSWYDAFALIRGPCVAQIEGTDITFVPDPSMVPRTEVTRVLKFFPKYEFYLTQFGVDICKFNGTSVTLRIIERSKLSFLFICSNLRII